MDQQTFALLLKKVERPPGTLSWAVAASGKAFLLLLRNL